MRKKILFLTCFFSSIYIFNAQEFGNKQFKINGGLPSNTVYEILQDKDGFLWFATDYGVSKFDGNNFTNFTVKDGIPDNEIFLMFIDQRNRLWFSGYNGNIGFFFDNKFHNRQNTSYLGDLKFSNFVYEIFEDSKGNIWFMQSKNQIKKLTLLIKLLIIH